MAELAASLLGITTFGAQSLKGAIELKELWSMLKDAPLEVKRLYDEACHVQKLLISLRSQRDQFSSFLIPCDDWEVCHEKCEAAAKVIENFCQVMRSEFAANRPVGLVKMALNRRHLEQIQRDLEWARTDVLIGQTAFSSAIQFQQLARVLKVQNFLEVHLPPNSRMAPTLSANMPCQSGAPMLNEAYDFQKPMIRRRRRSELDQQTFDIQSRWLRKVFKLDIQLSTSSWHFGISVRSLAPWDVLNCVRTDDLKGLQSHLKDGRVSVRDVDDEGRSLLQLSLFTVASKTAKFLFEFEETGIEDNALYFWSNLGLENKEHFLSDKIDIQRLSSIFELAEMLANSEACIDIEDLYDTPTGRRRLLFGTPEFLKLIHKQLYPPPEFWNMDRRLHLALRFANSPETFWIWYGKQHLHPDHAKSDLVLARIFCQIAGWVAAETEYERNVHNRWIGLASEVIQYGAIKATSKLRRSAIYAVVYEMAINTFKPALDSTFMRRWDRWLAFLKDAGQDLQEYCNLENEFLRAKGGINLPCASNLDGSPDAPWPRLLRIEYCNSTKHYLLYLADLPYDEWIGEFWDSVDIESELPIPGAWIEEKEVHDSTFTFKSLGTSRRKRRRYLRYMNFTSNNEATYFLGPRWNMIIQNNKRFGRLLQEQSSRIVWHPPEHWQWPQVGELADYLQSSDATRLNCFLSEEHMDPLRFRAPGLVENKWGNCQLLDARTGERLFRSNH